MLIDFKTLDLYFLTYKNELRKNNMLKEFKNYNLIEVNPCETITKKLRKHKYSSAISGMLKILSLASNKSNFKPFVILEDDVAKYREFPSNINIPDDTDILYIGLSQFGYKATKDHERINKIYSVYCKDINEDLVKVYNMLSTHGMIICSVKGLLIYQKCLLEAFFKSRAYDVFITKSQLFLNAYALKIPLVYQCGHVGGMENATKITSEYFESVPKLEDLTFDTESISVLTSADYFTKKKNEDSHNN